MNRVQLDVLQSQRSPTVVGEQLPRRVYFKQSVELATCGHTDRQPQSESTDCARRVLLLQVHGVPQQFEQFKQQFQFASLQQSNRDSVTDAS